MKLHEQSDKWHPKKRVCIIISIIFGWLYIQELLYPTSNLVYFKVSEVSTSLMVDNPILTLDVLIDELT
jgi:hypothetical protein